MTTNLNHFFILMHMTFEYVVAGIQTDLFLISHATLIQ